MYRDEDTLRCPACDTVMDRQPIKVETESGSWIEHAAIDVCPICGGIWADAIDGDVATVATQARVPDPGESAAPIPKDPPSCPRCAEALAAWEVSGTSLARCERCAGTFVPRAAIDTAMWLPPDAGAKPPDVRVGLARWVKRLLGRD